MSTHGQTNNQHCDLHEQCVAVMCTSSCQAQVFKLAGSLKHNRICCIWLTCLYILISSCSQAFRLHKKQHPISSHAADLAQDSLKKKNSGDYRAAERLLRPQRQKRLMLRDAVTTCSQGGVTKEGVGHEVCATWCTSHCQHWCTGHEWQDKRQELLQLSQKPAVVVNPLHLSKPWFKKVTLNSRYLTL